jgi:transcriptional regulator with XRE-family HTH domain
VSAVQAARAKRSAEADEVLVGPRLRAVREARGLSLADVATATGVSRSFLSMVENGESDIAFGRLHRLVNYYGIRFSDLVPPPAEDVPGLVRAGSERRLHSREEGIELHLLAPDTEREIMPLLSILAPGAATTEWEGHDGEEFIHVIEGSVEVSLKGRAPVTLEKGDSLHSHGREGQAIRNPTGREARLFVVIWPPL